MPVGIDPVERCTAVPGDSAAAAAAAAAADAVSSGAVLSVQVLSLDYSLERHHNPPLGLIDSPEREGVSEGEMSFLRERTTLLIKIRV